VPGGVDDVVHVAGFEPVQQEQGVVAVYRIGM
jgi:hypothetical protein